MSIGSGVHDSLSFRNGDALLPLVIASIRTVGYLGVKSLGRIVAIAYFCVASARNSFWKWLRYGRLLAEQLCEGSDLPSPGSIKLQASYAVPIVAKV